MKKFVDSGHVNFKLQHTDFDWLTNDKAYNFGTSRNKGVTLSIAKEPNGILRFDITGALRFPETIGIVHETDLAYPYPSVLPISISWGRGKISLYVMGKRVSEFILPK